jgi:adenylate cyclase
LKNEVISHLRYFKQKVDERTSELQIANNKLIAINEANSKFVPREFLQFLGRSSVEEISPGDQVAGEMTILFTDIRSFTEISEMLSPQDNFDFINAYLKEIVPVIRANHGFIDKFIGDTVMAIFPGSPDDAIKAALDFGRAVDQFNLTLLDKNIPPIAIGTGIHTGNLILGTIGNAHRLETTVISDAVNIASRIEGLTKYYHASIIVSEETMQQTKTLHGLCFRYIDEVRVKGKLKSVRIYEILDPEKDKRKVVFLQEYETAMMNFREKKFAEARAILTDLVLKNPEDHLARILLQKCQKLLDHGVPQEWDGIEIMQSK